MTKTFDAVGRRPSSARATPTEGDVDPGLPNLARPPLATANGMGRALLGPSWFAAVMGTGIVANAAATLPRSFPGLRTAAT